MVAFRFLQNLPDSREAQEAYLAKLRDRETRLEADLAIKENPELEDAIIEIAVLLAEIRRIDGMLFTINRSTIDNKVSIKSNEDLIKFYGNKIRELREQEETDRVRQLVKLYTDKIDGYKSMLDKLKAGNTIRGLEMKSAKRIVISNLRTKVNEWREKFDDKASNVLELIPSLDEYISE